MRKFSLEHKNNDMNNLITLCVPCHKRYYDLADNKLLK